MASDPSANGEPIAPTASAEEAAAIVAALARFARDTARPPEASIAEHEDPWRREALLEGVRRRPAPFSPEPWING